MDITAFIEKTYNHMKLNGKAVKPTLNEQIDDIIYKNGYSDQVANSGHIKKEVDGYGKVRVYYRTYDYSSNPILEDTDFDGIRDDVDLKKLDNKFSGRTTIESGNMPIDYHNDFRWFFTNPNKYNDELAVMSLIASNLARGKNVNTDQASGDIVQYLQRLGFTDVRNISDNGEVYVGKKSITYYGITKNIYSVVIGERNLENNYYAMFMKAKEATGNTNVV